MFSLQSIKKFFHYLLEWSIEIFIIMTFLFSGKLWFWNIFSIIPSPFFLILAIISVVIKTFTGKFKYLIFSFFVVFLCFNISDIHVQNLIPKDYHGQYGKTLKFVSWNTQFWQEGTSKDAFYAFLQDQKADVYQLQEFNNAETLTEVGKHFKGYFLDENKDVITISKYPIKTHYKESHGSFMRSDINIDGKIISLYNMHLPIHLLPSLVRDPYAFLVNMKEKFETRQNIIQELEKNVLSNEYSYIVSGDFNSTLSMGVMNALLSKSKDSYDASKNIYPVTWMSDGWLSLYRIDYALSSLSGLIPISYDEIARPEFSDHKALVVTYGLTY